MSTIDAAQRLALEQAAHWYTRLQCETAQPGDQLAWQTWLQAAPANRWAWQQIERLQNRLQGMPQHLASRTLGLAGQANNRRSVLKGIALLIANDQRLGAFIAELSRYRSGWLRCDPAIAHLRISGTFALDDTDQALRALASALPVNIEQRSRYWVTVTAR